MPANPYQSFEVPRPSKHPRRFRLAWVVFFVVYVCLYADLSRRGFAQADAMELEGLWFFTPEDGGQWRTLHYTCAIVFAPLIVFDNGYGTGRPITNEPIWDLGP